MPDLVYASKHRVRFIIGCSIFIIVCLALLIMYYDTWIFYPASVVGSIFIAFFMYGLLSSNEGFNRRFNVPDSYYDYEQGQPAEGYPMYRRRDLVDIDVV